MQRCDGIINPVIHSCTVDGQLIVGISIAAHGSGVVAGHAWWCFAFIYLDQHRINTVDLHRANGRCNQLPIIFHSWWFRERKVMAWRLNADNAIMDCYNTKGDIRTVLPMVRLVQKKFISIRFISSNMHQQFFRSRTAVNIVAPVLSDRKSFCRGGGNRIRINVIRCLRASIRARICITYRCIRIGFQSVIVAIFHQVLLDVRIQTVISRIAVLQVGNQVQRVLAGIDVECNLICNAIQQCADGRKIPVNFRIRERSSRRSIIVK